MHFSVKIGAKTSVIWKGIFLLFVLFLSIPTLSQNYTFRNFTTDQGLAQSYVYSIIQDGQGYLWVGTGNGLSRYNGFIFETYTTRDSLADNFVSCGITEGERLWFGHMNGQLSYFDGKKFHSIKLPQPAASPITHLAKSPNGGLWASSYADGLMRIDFSPIRVTSNLFEQQTAVIVFEFLDDSTMLVGTNTGLLYCKLTKSGKIKIIELVAGIPEAKVTSIQKMRNKSGFYIATETDGLYRLTPHNSSFHVSKLNLDSDGEFTGLQIVYEDSHSNLWLGSFGNGLINMAFSASGELKKVNRFKLGNGFSTDNVKTVFEDREGNIWSGNYGQGLTQIISKPFSLYPLDNVLYGHSIFSIYSDWQFRWVGTERGLVKMDRMTDKIVKFYGNGSGLPNDRITSIYSSDGKILWIGTENRGLFRMDVMREKIRNYPMRGGTLENSITIITGKGEQIWVGTKKGLCSINSDNNRNSWYSISRGGLPHNFINGLYLDKANRLWVTTRSNILAFIRNEKVVKIPINSGSGVFTLGPIAEDSESRIWVGSSGNGIFMIESDSIINLTTKQGLLTNFCYSLILDDHRNIWVGHKGGLSKIRTTDFLVKTIHQFDGRDDRYQFMANAVVKDMQEKIWFGSDRGLVAYDPLIENTRISPPLLSITSFKVNDKERDYRSKVILAPGNYKIRIDFLGISLKEPDLVTYQYKLDGYDQWSDITKNTTVTYSHLAAGDYTFTLKSFSGEGAVSDSPLTLDVWIKKPIHNKWWFYPVIILLLVILTLIYFKRREHLFLMERRILEDKVRERTHEIQCQKQEIELQRDIIEAKNTSITASIRYASSIQNAVLPPIELLDKLLPEYFILSKPKDIVSGDFFWLTEKDDKVIFTVADCTGHGVAGAFMSLLGITFLNEIVNIQGVTSSNIIIAKLCASILQSLHKNGTSFPSAEGIDLSLCVMDKQQQRIQFTGAMNDLVYIRDGQLEIVKADRSSVSVLCDDSSNFSINDIDYREGDVFYLFSDGYKDQFGGNRFKRYSRQRFYNTLLRIHGLPMVTQREILEQKLREWMRDNVQTDDISVMGIRL